MSKQILIFGDSIAYGAWDEKGGWVDRLKCEIHEKVISSKLVFYCDIYNLSIDGDYTDKLLKRFEFETKQRMIEEEIIIIFAIGINDSCFIKGKNKTDREFEEFRKNISKLILLSSKFSARTIFLGFTPVDEEKTNPIPWSITGACCKNEYIKKYNDILGSICLEKSVDLIEIYDEFLNVKYKKFLFDGVHPNSAGHEKIFEIVNQYLKNKKII